MLTALFKRGQNRKEPIQKPLRLCVPRAKLNNEATQLAIVEIH